MLHKAAKTKCENFIFVHWSSFFLSLTWITQKQYGVCESHKYQKDCSATRHLPFLVHGWCTSYCYKIVLSTHNILTQQLLGLLSTYSRCGTYSQATPRLLNVCVTGCDEFVSNQLWVLKQKFAYSFLYLLGLEHNLMQQKMLLCT